MPVEHTTSPKKKTSSPDYQQLGRHVVEASGNNPDCKPSAGLYLVATPIGHLGDISLRALATLAGADAIGCEDTRTSATLFNAFGIKKPTFSCHDHNEAARAESILSRIKGGEVVCIVSDAGMPAIADPGFTLVRACRDAGLPVTVIPGANAAITALAGSGLATDAFHFLGFLPPKSTARRKSLTTMSKLTATLIAYEAPQRLASTLDDMAEILGGSRAACVARELTKFYEESRRGSLAELREHYAVHAAKGECVILVARSESSTEIPDLEAYLREYLPTSSMRDAVAEISALTGIPKKEVYARALELKLEKP